MLGYDVRRQIYLVFNGLLQFRGMGAVLRAYLGLTNKSCPLPIDSRLRLCYNRIATTWLFETPYRLIEEEFRVVGAPW